MKTLYILFIAAIFAFSQVNAQPLKHDNESKIQSSFPNFSLRWCTYYPFHITSIAVDRNGNVIVAGDTWLTVEISTPGAFQEKRSGPDDIYINDEYVCTGGDAFISKFNSSGMRLWSTYFGGTGVDELTGLCLDSSDNIIISGYTTSKNGIVHGNAFQAKIGSDSLVIDKNKIRYTDIDYFISKFSPEGKMQWSTYLGGELRESGFDKSSLFNPNHLWGSCNYTNGSNICVDSLSNIYFAGVTASTQNIATQGAYKQSPELRDALICKISAKGEKLWCTYYGGNGDESVYGIKCDKDNNLIIAGRTNSTDGIASPEAFQNKFLANLTYNTFDWFIAKFNDSGNRIWGTYFGGDNEELNVSLALSGNDIFIAGETRSYNLPEKNNAFPKEDYNRLFVTGFTKDGDMIWGTYLYSLPYYNHANGVQLNSDSYGNLILFGSTLVNNNIITKAALKTSLEKEDVFIVIFDKSGKEIAGTYYGGMEYENVIAGAAGKNGKIYIAGSTNSTSGMTTPGAHREKTSFGVLLEYITALTYSPMRQITGDTIISKHILACEDANWKDTIKIKNISNDPLYISPFHSFFVNKTPGLVLENIEDSLRISGNRFANLFINYSFQPGSPSIIRDTLLIPHSDFFMGDTAWRVAIEIIIDSLDLSVDRNVLDYGSIPSCEMKRDSVLYKNISPCDITITELPKITGDNPEDFGIYSGPALPITLKPGDSIRFVIDFSPKPGHTGKLSAMMQLKSPNGYVRIPLVSLTGISEPINLSSNPVTVDFNLVIPGSKGSKKLTIENNNSYPVTISKVISNNPEISITPHNVVIPKYGSQIFDVDWSPTLPGVLSAAVQFIIDSPCIDTISIPATGRAPGSGVAVTDVIDFGTLAFCETAIDSVIIINNGETDISVNSSEIGGTNKDAFSIDNQILAKSLPAGQRMAMAVRIDFSKLPSGKATAEVITKIKVGSEDKEYITSLAVDVARFANASTSLAFPETQVSKSNTLKFTYKNNATLPVTIDKAVILSFKGIYTINPDPVNLEVKAGDSTKFDVTFTPTEEKEYPDKIRLYLSMRSCKDEFDTDITGKGIIPLKLRIYVSMPDTSAKVGDEFCIPVYGHTEKGEATGKFETLIEMANDIFEPIIPYTRTTSNLTVQLKGDVHFTETDTKIAEICGQILLSNVVKSPLKFNSFTFSDPDAEIIKKDGSLTITGACMPNLQKITMSEPLKMSIRPNPAGDIIKLAISSQKDNAITITITDVLGRLIYTQNIISSGNDEITIDASLFGSGIYRLNASSYYGSGNVMLQIVK